MPTQLSKCCGAEIKVACGDNPPHAGSTRWHVCTKCEQPCDPAPIAQQAEQLGSNEKRAGAIPSGDTKDYTLSPEVEKEFDEMLTSAEWAFLALATANKFKDKKKYAARELSGLKSFFARVIAEEVKKARVAEAHEWRKNTTGVVEIYNDLLAAWGAMPLDADGAQEIISAVLHAKEEEVERVKHTLGNS